MEANGYKQVFFMDNIKIVVSLISTLLGVYAHFYCKYPKEKYMLIACVVSYFICATFLWVVRKQEDGMISKLYPQSSDSTNMLLVKDK